MKIGQILFALAFLVVGVMVALSGFRGVKSSI